MFVSIYFVWELLDEIMITWYGIQLKDKYPNFEVGLRCILMLFPYLLLYSHKENAM